MNSDNITRETLDNLEKRLKELSDENVNMAKEQKNLTITNKNLIKEIEAKQDEINKICYEIAAKGKPQEKINVRIRF
jgi:uncharacterized protein YoxC